MDAIVDQKRQDAAGDRPAGPRPRSPDEAAHGALDSALVEALKLRLLEAPTEKLRTWLDAVTGHKPTSTDE